MDANHATLLFVTQRKALNDMFDSYVTGTAGDRLPMSISRIRTCRADSGAPRTSIHATGSPWV